MEVTAQLHVPAALPCEKQLWVPIREHAVQSREEALLKSLATVCTSLL
jgi:hypothetical protein